MSLIACGALIFEDSHTRSNYIPPPVGYFRVSQKTSKLSDQVADANPGSL